MSVTNHDNQSEGAAYC